MKRPTIERVHEVMRQQEMKVFTKVKSNTMGWIRTKDNKANTFNDWLFISHPLENGGIKSVIIPGTTDAGLYWRLNPMHVDGTAIIQHGKQYRGAFTYMKSGGHRGGEGIRQTGPLDYFRDVNRDEYLDFVNPQYGKIFNTNGHNMFGETVDKDSAGCWGALKKLMRDYYDMCQDQIDAGLGAGLSLAALHEDMF